MKRDSNRKVHDEAVRKCDQLIDTLKSIERCNHAPTVDVNGMLNKARRLKTLIRKEYARSIVHGIREWIEFAVKIAKDIHSMINCYSRPVIHHENGIDHKTAQNGFRTFTRRLCREAWCNPIVSVTS